MDTNIEFEIYQVTCKTLHSILKEKIKGGIVVKVHWDVLNVKIINDGFEYHYIHTNWLDYCRTNADMYAIANEVVKDFKHVVLNKYFI